MSKKLTRGPIKDFALGIYDGPHATPAEVSDGPIFLGIRNVTPEGRLDLTEVRHISEQEFPKWTRRVEPKQDDIVFSYEATLHRYALISGDLRCCLGRRMALVRPNPEKVVPRFLHYYFLSSNWRSVVEANVISGATVDRIPIAKFPDFEVQIPSLEDQLKIASILSTYDDLIENNRRRIQLLEESARLLYREWFVHLRFPGHEHVKIIDGVPEGWEKIHLSKIVDTQYGFTASATNENIGPKFLRGTDINKTSYIDWANVPYCPEDGLEYSKYALKEGDILLIRMADPGKVAIVETSLKAIFASYLVRLTIKPQSCVTPYFLFYTLDSEQYQGFITGASTGSTRKSASAKLLVDFNLIQPPYSLLSLFDDYVLPLRQNINTLLSQNAALQKARDLLLPRLMNGEITL
jgi:type I restriction enzyme S subunit